MALRKPLLFAASRLALCLFVGETLFAQYVINTFESSNPSGVIFDGQAVSVDGVGNVYATGVVPGTNGIGAFSAILMVTPAGSVTRVVGSNQSNAPFPGCGYPATQIGMTDLGGVSVSQSGIIYVAQSGNGPLLQDSGGTVTCLLADQYFGASGIVNDGAGNVYFTTGQAGGVYEATSGGALVTIAGTGTIGCTGADIGKPMGVALDSHSNLFIADPWCNVIWEVTSSGRFAVAGIPGNANTGFSGDGGPATSATLSAPTGVAVDANGNIYIADWGSARIREVTNGIINTIGGNGNSGYSGDGGPATNAAVDAPYSVGLGLNGSIYVGETGDIGDGGDRIRVLTPLSVTPISFVPVTPCRAVDTRNPDGPLGGPGITAGASRNFAIAGQICGIPSSAVALSLNAAIVPTSHGYMTLWPTGEPQPGTASVNSPDGGVHSNGAIVPAGTDGAISAYAFSAMDVVLDINGYFVTTAANPSALAFYPLTPCRVADTRNADGNLGGPFVAGGTTRTFPILEAAAACNISSVAQAYSLNIAVVPRTGVFHYLTAWPAGESQPAVASLNDPQSVNHSSGAIVPAGTGGGIDVYVTNDADVILDINGYFAPPATGGLSLYALQPCRVLDTRNPAGSPPFTGTITVNVEGSGCAPASSAQAYVFNATVVPQSRLARLPDAVAAERGAAYGGEPERPQRRDSPETWRSYRQTMARLTRTSRGPLTWYSICSVISRRRAGGFASRDSMPHGLRR